MGNQQATLPYGKKNRRLNSNELGLAILFAGPLFTWWTAVRTDREMRSDLLVQTRLSLNIARIRALSGTTEVLGESEEKYRLVAENARKAIIVKQDMNVVFVSSATADMMGYSGDISTAKSFAEFIDADDLNMVADACLKLFREKGYQLEGSGL